jgi:regulator of sirC expression with transglutaminase-like and TPR domain
MRERQLREHFEKLAQETDATLDLARGALLIAAEDDPSVDVEDTLGKLRAMSRELAERIGKAGTPEDALAHLGDYLHRDCGLRGDEKTYYDPRNSFLPQVLVRKKGIPISLAVIYITVGRGAGLQLTGVSFPAHFLVGAYRGHQHDLIPDYFINPFNPAKLLSADDCRDLFTKLGGSAAAFRDSMLKAVSPRQILTRMLTNLKMIYAQTEQPEKAIAAIDRILLLNPDASNEYRDRGALHMHLDLYKLALADFERYLADEPDDDERIDIEQAVATLRERISMLH